MLFSPRFYFINYRKSHDENLHAFPKISSFLFFNLMFIWLFVSNVSNITELQNSKEFKAELQPRPPKRTSSAKLNSAYPG